MTESDRMSTTIEVKPLPPRFLAHTHEFDYKTYFLRLPVEYSYSDLFAANFWTHHARKLRRYDLVRVVDTAGRFDVLLTVDSTPFGEPRMRLFTGSPPPEAQQRKLPEPAEHEEAA